MAAKPHLAALADLADRIEVAAAFAPSAERRAAFHQATGLPVAAGLRLGVVFQHRFRPVVRRLRAELDRRRERP